MFFFIIIIFGGGCDVADGWWRSDGEWWWRQLVCVDVGSSVVDTVQELSEDAVSNIIISTLTVSLTCRFTAGWRNASDKKYLSCLKTSTVEKTRSISQTVCVWLTHKWFSYYFTSIGFERDCASHRIDHRDEQSFSVVFVESLVSLHNSFITHLTRLYRICWMGNDHEWIDAMVDYQSAQEEWMRWSINSVTRVTKRKVNQKGAGPTIQWIRLSWTYCFLYASGRCNIIAIVMYLCGYRKWETRTVGCTAQ